MTGRLLRGKRGFTLVEILIVIVIIAILVAIAVPKFISIASKAEESVWKYNSTYLVKIFALNIYKYEGEARYSANAADDSLNNFLYNDLEGYQENDNRDNIKNPKSRSKKILHGNSPVGGTIENGRNPAVFITGNPAYSHTGTGSTENLIGSIVAYINQSEPYNVQVYYIDRDGEKSDKMADFD